MTASADIVAAPAIRPPRVNPVQAAGLALLALLGIAVLFGPFLTPYGASEIVCAPFDRPSRAHLLGCNDVGQDLLTGVLAGGRISLAVGLVTAAIATLIATGVAIGSAWQGGFADVVTMRFVDAVMALPFLPLVVVLSAFFGASFTVQIGILCLVLWTQPVRELRSQALHLRHADHTDAARAMGGSGWHITTRHLLPELTPLIVPQFVRIAHAALLTESALSFLGLGDPTAKSWGTILFHANARTAFLTDAWLWWVLPPGFLIALSVLALALAGHGIGDRRQDGTLPDTPRDGPKAARRTEAAFAASSVSVSYAGAPALRAVSVDIPRGTTLGLIGESGSGKSTLAMTALRLLPPSARIVGGSVWVGQEDLLSLPATALRHVRGRRVALVPQAAMNALDPVRTVGWQIGDALRVHGTTGRLAHARVDALMARVGLPEERRRAYPHELSGGMRQRVALAIALAAEPEVLIADEPTTGLDVLVQKSILDLIEDLSCRLGLTVLFITHDLPMIARRAERLTLLQGGRVVDTGTPHALERTRAHPHTRALFDAVLPLHAEKTWPRPSASGPAWIAAREVSVCFNAGLAGRIRGTRPVQALRRVSLTLRQGEVLGLVGGSGSGKTTLARAIAGLVRPSEGEVRVFGAAPKASGDVAMIFQDPYQSMRAAMRVEAVVAEPLRVSGRPTDAVRGAVREALTSVGLPSDTAFLERRLSSLSGGQRQRVAVARAIIARPRVLIADEPTSMLDQSLRAELLDLLERLRSGLGLAILFITHDLALARHFCDRLSVMHHGEIVETGTADAIIGAPTHPYTKALIEAADA